MTMPANLSKEQVEELTEHSEAVRLGLIGWYGSAHLAKHMSTGDSPRRMVEALKAALLTLARSAPSPELVALGEAAVELGRDELQPGETFTKRSGRISRAKIKLEQAARTFARTVEGDNNGR
jgi:hypothetical protein